MIACVVLSAMYCGCNTNCCVFPLQIYVDGEVVHTGLHPLLTFNVTNLTCGASYSIGVTAGNSAGHGWVNQVRIQTSRRVGDAEGTVCVLRCRFESVFVIDQVTQISLFLSHYRESG